MITIITSQNTDFIPIEKRISWLNEAYHLMQQAVANNDWNAFKTWHRVHSTINEQLKAA